MWHEWLSSGNHNEDTEPQRFTDSCIRCGVSVELPGPDPRKRTDRDPNSSRYWFIGIGDARSVIPDCTGPDAPSRHQWYVSGFQRWRDERGRFTPGGITGSGCDVVECYGCDARVDMHTSTDDVPRICPGDPAASYSFDPADADDSSN